MPFNEGLKFLIIFGNVRNLCQSPRPPEISEILSCQSRFKKTTNEEFTIAQKCRTSEAFKTETLKNAYKTTWTKSLNSRVKIRHNVSLENLNFEFLVV